MKVIVFRCNLKNFYILQNIFLITDNFLNRVFKKKLFISIEKKKYYRLKPYSKVLCLC